MSLASTYTMRHRDSFIARHKSWLAGDELRLLIVGWCGCLGGCCVAACGCLGVLDVVSESTDTDLDLLIGPAVQAA